MNNKYKAKVAVKKKALDVDVDFCTNCDGLDDFAVSPEVKEVGKLYQRFHNCEDTGNFEGDLCSRLYVALDGVSEADELSYEE